MSIEDCHQRVADISGGQLPFQASFLKPIPPRQILSRMLRNLKGVYTAHGAFESAISVVEKLILLNASAAEEVRDLGMLHYYTRHRLKAIGCLERYLRLSPNAEDAEIVRHNLRAILEKVARWN